MKHFTTCVVLALASLSVHAEVDMGLLLGTLVQKAAQATLSISGTYHGVPVKRIVHEFGEGEFNEMSLELDAPKATVQAALHGVHFHPDPNSGLRAVVEYQPQRIRVLCDHSL